MLSSLKEVLDRVKTLTHGQRTAITNTHESHDALLDAQRHLHEALNAGQPGRTREWVQQVATKLKAAQHAIERHTRLVRNQDGLYVALQHEAPQLAEQIEDLIEDMEFIAVKAADLAAMLEEIGTGDHKSLSKIRPDTALMIAHLHALMAKENDLIFRHVREQADST